MLSVIDCSADRVKAAAVSAHYRGLLGARPHELIVIADARSLAEGYNRRVAQPRQIAGGEGRPARAGRRRRRHGKTAKRGREHQLFC